MEQQGEFDVVVVGCGMIGAAAARELCALGNPSRVCLVGPEECDPRSADPGRFAFGAHYDEGRIARRSDPDPTWSWLAQRAIDRYGELERISGVKFFNEVGHLTCGEEGSDHMRSVAANAAAFAHEELSSEKLRERFPFLSFGPGVCGVYEPDGAGYVSARRQVAASAGAAVRAGCRRVVAEVAAVHRLGPARFAVELVSGQKITCSKVLVAAGAFTNSRPLLPDASGSHVALQLQLLTAQTLRVEVAAADAARLSTMPSIVLKRSDYWCYVLPPIQYPCGKWFLKIGGSWTGRGGAPPQRNPLTGELQTPVIPGKRILHSQREVAEWYRSSGDPGYAAAHAWMLSRLLPGLHPQGFVTDTCVTCHTETRQLYVGCTGPGIAVATAGNGFAAKSALEIGRMAAFAVHAGTGRWMHELPQERFAPRLMPMTQRELTQACSKL
eukprot:TRINITY_DN5485_c0_g1_i2.p1 TRINITY_DN5485_c0_g1~~TRINITY_DN5485_c0_g1_i2.p1  ORF type:complete len:441 (+),score=108.54 TRINITY_DN5485_c0_g1_i2:69-1391(+)